MSTPAGKFAPSDLAWGVEEVAGERNVLLVRSKSQPSVKHRVELEAYAGFGSCTCEWFRQFGKATKAEAALLAGRFPDERSLCEHLRRARTYCHYKRIQFDIATRAQSTRLNICGLKREQLTGEEREQIIDDYFNTP